MKKNNKAVFFLIFVLILSLGSSGCKNQNAAETPPETGTGFVAETSETQTSVASELKTETSSAATSAETTEASVRTTVQEVWNSEDFVYPDDPLTVENLMYLIFEAKKILEEGEMSVELRRLYSYRFGIVDINFDGFPELYYTETDANELYYTETDAAAGYKRCKVFSLEKEQFAQLLVEFEGFHRDGDTSFMVKEEDGNKRFIIYSKAKIDNYKSNLISEITYDNGEYQNEVLFKDTWLFYYPEGSDNKIESSEIDGINVDIEEYLSAFENFTDNLTELPAFLENMAYFYTRPRDLPKGVLRYNTPDHEIYYRIPSDFELLKSQQSGVYGYLSDLCDKYLNAIKNEEHVYPDNPLASADDLLNLVFMAKQRLYLNGEMLNGSVVYIFGLVDIDFDGFPELFLHRKQGGQGLSLCTMYSLKKESFCECLFDFQAYSRYSPPESGSVFMIKEDENGKRIIIDTYYYHSNWQKIETIGEVFVSDEGYSWNRTFFEEWLFNINSFENAIAQYNGDDIQYDEYKALIDDFLSDVSPVDYLKEPVEYIMRSPENRSINRFVKDEEKDYEQLYDLYDEYLKSIKE